MMGKYISGFAKSSNLDKWAEVLGRHEGDPADNTYTGKGGSKRD
jgi:hypothetical protein